MTENDQWIAHHIPGYLLQVKDLVSNSLSVGECDFNAETHIALSQSQQVLGMEFDFIVLDFRRGFDANHFCRILGTLVGGGMALVIPPRHQESLAGQWLSSIFADLPKWPIGDDDLVQPLNRDNNIDYQQQDYAIKKILKVVTGHRHRPFVLTADRGRGKTSALGIACADLLYHRQQCSIVVTAPSFRQVSTLFKHARNALPEANCPHPHQLTYANNRLRFLPPAEITADLDCDVLLVDEAGAIPVPLLKQWAYQFPRLVFSTTIHGYEGSGRGFTLKFLPWLSSLRKNVPHLHLDQPIRWAANDNIEQWLNHHFVLDSEVKNLVINSEAKVTYRVLDKSDLVNDPRLLRQCIGLLVQAHYQTTPNDVFQLIENSDQNMVIAELDHQVVATCLVNCEGMLSDAKVNDIVRGQSRPKGQLATSILMTNLGCINAGYWQSQRIMRIAVHPQAQRQGIASALCRYMETHLQLDFVSVSFGAEAELMSFWLSLGFFPVRLGLTRDAASGTYSLLMIKPCRVDCRVPLSSLRYVYSEQLLENLKYLSSPIDLSLLRLLLNTVCVCPQSEERVLQSENLLDIYSRGGGSFEFVQPLLASWLLTSQAIERCSSLLLRAVFCYFDSGSLCREFSLSGKKQLDQALRNDVLALFSR